MEERDTLSAMEPKVSVIIPAYNTEARVGQAIQSVLDQTEQRFEIIVVDDGSTDRTVEVVKGFADERVRLHVTEQNRGANNARNCAIEMASGEWVALLDSDDWYAPQRLEKLLQAANRLGDVDMIADNVYEIPAGGVPDLPSGTYRDERGGVREVKTLFTEGMKANLPAQLSAAAFIRGNKTGPDNLRLGLVKPLFKRAFLQENNLRYDEDVRRSQDTVFYLKCLVHGARFILIPQPYYVYRQDRPGAIGDSKSPLEAMRHRHVLNERMLQQAQERRPHDRELKRALLLRQRGLERMMRYYTFRKYLHTHPSTQIWRQAMRNPYGLFVFLIWEKPWNYHRIRRLAERFTHALAR